MKQGHRRTEVLAFGLLLSGSAAAVSNNLGRLEEYVRFVHQENQNLLTQLEKSTNDPVDPMDPMDRDVITPYYMDIRMHYLADPLKEVLQNGQISEALKDYATALEQAPKINRLSIHEGSVRDCVEREAGIKNLSGLASGLGSLEDLEKSLTHPILPRMPASMASWEGQNNFTKAVQSLLNKDLSGSLISCCREEGSKAETATTKEDQEKACKKMEASLAGATKRLDDALTGLEISYNPPPNPLAISKLSPEDIAHILIARGDTSQDIGTKMAEARQESGFSEQDVFYRMSTCRDQMAMQQHETSPWKGPVLNNIGKLVKCSLLPYFTTTQSDLQWQRLSLVLASVPIQGQVLDMNCSPQEIANWAAMRPDYSPEVDLKWGIPQLENPPYLADLGGPPPIQARWALDGMSADMLVDMVPTTTGAYAASTATRTGSTATRASRGTGRQLAYTKDMSGAAGGRASASRGAGSMRGNFGRGLERGRQLVQSTRQASAYVQKNNRPEYYASRIQSGARNTRAFVAKGARRTVARGASAVAGARRLDARKAWGYTSRALSVKASRATTEGLLNSLESGKREPVATKKVRPVSNRGLNQEQRAALKAKFQGLLDRMSQAKNQIASLQQQIAKNLAARQVIINELRLKYKDKAPSKQGDMVLAARAKIQKVDVENGALRAQQLLANSLILQQDGEINRIMTFGQDPTSAPTGPRVEREKSGFEGLPAAYTPPADFAGMDPSLLEIFGEFFNPVRSAWAADLKKVESLESHWSREWKRFQKEYAVYAQRKRDQERQVMAEGAALWSAYRARQKDTENFYELSTDSLVAADLFLAEVTEESQHMMELERQRELQVSTGVVASLRQAKEEATAARQDWIQHQQIWYQSLPKAEDNAEALWALVPSFFMD